MKFSFPDASQRGLIWRKSFPQKPIFKQNPARLNGNGSSTYQDAIDIPEAVKKYELTGGNILNVVHYAGIKAIEKLNSRKDKNGTSLNGSAVSGQSHPEPQLVIYLSDVINGIKREMVKEGKAFT